MTRRHDAPPAADAAPDDDLLPQESEAVEAAGAIAELMEPVPYHADPVVALTPGGLTPENLAEAMGLPAISPDIAGPAIAAAHATIEREMGRRYPPALPHNLAQARWMCAATLVLMARTEPLPHEELPARVRYFIMLAQGKRR